MPEKPGRSTQDKTSPGLCNGQLHIQSTPWDFSRDNLRRQKQMFSSGSFGLRAHLPLAKAQA
jgi:hypothetical protein